MVPATYKHNIFNLPSADTSVTSWEREKRQALMQDGGSTRHFYSERGSDVGTPRGCDSVTILSQPILSGHFIWSHRCPLTGGLTVTYAKQMIELLFHFRNMILTRQLMSRRALHVVHYLEYLVKELFILLTWSRRDYRYVYTMLAELQWCNDLL